jgi:hypothetical protein
LEEDDEHGLEDIIPLHNKAFHMERTVRNWKMAKFTNFLTFHTQQIRNYKTNSVALSPQANYTD